MVACFYFVSHGHGVSPVMMLQHSVRGFWQTYVLYCARKLDDGTVGVSGSIKLDLVVLVTDEFSYGVSKVSER
jgi:hypothetical protein